MTVNRPYQTWVFIDESGNLAQETDRFVLMAALVAERTDGLQQLVKRVKRGARPPIRGQALHATTSAPAVNLALLRQMATHDEVRLCIVALDKQFWWRRDLPQVALYQALVTYTVGCAFQVAKEPVQVVLERRYKQRYQAYLAEAVADGAGLEPATVLSEPKESTQWGAALQVTDAVAWALYQKLNRADASYADLIAERIVHEEVVGVDAQGEIVPVAQMGGNEKGQPMG